MLLSISTLLLAACSTVPSSAPDKRVAHLTVPNVRAYTKSQQQQAAAELKLYGPKIPMVSTMMIDYGKMRDSARIAKGLKVDINR